MTSFAIVVASHCIEIEKKCDGRKHCVDGSDEVDCQTCAPHQFTCRAQTANGGSECVDAASVCDGTSDCSDASDEFNCNVSACDEGFFGCSVTSPDATNISM